MTRTRKSRPETRSQNRSERYMPAARMPGIRCTIQGHQSGRENRCADMFKKSWKPRLEELYAREHGARTPPLSVSPASYSAPSIPVTETPTASPRAQEPETKTETTPLLPGRLATPSNRWVVRSYSAMQSRDILWVAGRVEALTPPPSPSSDSDVSFTSKRASQTEFKAAQRAQQDLDLEAGRLRQGDEKGYGTASQQHSQEDSSHEYGQASRELNICFLCKRAMFILLTAFWILVIVMAFREKYGFFA
jgi:hypothetical protein